MKHKLGAWGESIIAQWFQWQGYKVKAQNMMTPFGEIDLWVQLGRRSYLAEIKTRSTAPQDLFTSGLTHLKIRRMRLIRAYIYGTLPTPPYRPQIYCSFILLIPQSIFWIPDIFDPNPVCATLEKIK